MTTIDGMLELDFTSYVDTKDATRDMMFHGEVITWLVQLQEPYAYHLANMYADDWEIIALKNGMGMGHVFRASTLELMKLFVAKLKRQI